MFGIRWVPLLSLLAASFTGAAGSAAPAFVPDSSQIEHPAALHLVTDRRLEKEPQAMEELARTALELGEERVLSLIRTEHGLDRKMLCPGCGSAELTFSLKEPEAVRCSECRVAITEAAFPPTGEVSGPNSRGEYITYRFFKKGTTEHFITAHARLRCHLTLAEASRALAWMYHTTREEKYARLAIAILDRFATVYPHWPVVEMTMPASYLRVYRVGKPRPYSGWWVGRWSWLFVEEIPQDLVFAYDLTYGSPEWEKLSAARGYNARRHVEDDLFRPAYHLAMQAYEDQEGDIGNLSATLFQSMIHLGRVLNDPDMVHAAVQGMSDMVRMSYHFDGMEYEGTVTYHGVVTGRLGIAERALRGYTDPPGYVDQRFGLRLDNAEFGRQFPIFGKAWRVWSAYRFPNGNPVCIHDTNWAEDRAPTPPDAEAGNIEMNAYGHFAIGRGKGPDAMQAHLHFCPRSSGGHFHQDRLNLILWAAGEELLSDIGYVHVGKKHRYFVNSILCHNTVDVLFDQPPTPPKENVPTPLPRDPIARFRAEAEAQRPAVDARSRLLAYDPGTLSGKQVQLVEASSPGPEWMGITTRQRALLLVAADAHRSYLVDLFRVAGGNRHRFILRPSADEDVTTQCSLTLTPRPGTLAGPDVPYGQLTRSAPAYSWLIHNLKTATTAQPWQLTWQGVESGASLRAFFRPQPGTEVILAQSPTLRRGRQDSRLADESQGPHLLVERQGNTGFASLFGGVYDGWRQGAAPVVDSVEWLDLENDATALVVRLGNREDLLYAAPDRQARLVRGYRLAARFALLSFRAGNLAWAWCHDGSATGPGLTLDTGETVRLPITRVLRRAAGDPVDGFVVDGRLESPAALTGQWLRAILGDGTTYGYRIEGVEAQGAQSRITLHDEPGWVRTETGAELLFNPFFRIPGACQVEIARSAFAALSEAP